MLKTALHSPLWNSFAACFRSLSHDDRKGRLLIDSRHGIRLLQRGIDPVRDLDVVNCTREANRTIDTELHLPALSSGCTVSYENGLWFVDGRDGRPRSEIIGFIDRYAEIDRKVFQASLSRLSQFDVSICP